MAKTGVIIDNCNPNVCPCKVKNCYRGRKKCYSCGSETCPDKAARSCVVMTPDEMQTFRYAQEMRRKISSEQKEKQTPKL